MSRTFKFATRKLPAKGLREFSDQLLGLKVEARTIGDEVEITIVGERSSELPKNEDAIRRLAKEFAKVGETAVSIFNDQRVRIGVMALKQK